MFGRECARILRAVSCNTRLRFLCSFPVPRDRRSAVSWSYNEIFIRAFHDAGQPVESQVVAELKVPLDPFLLVADEYEILADKLQRMIVTELPKLASNAEFFFNMLVKERRFQPSVLLLMEKVMIVPASTQTSKYCVEASPLRFTSRHQCIPEIAGMSNIYNYVRHNMLDAADTRYHVSSLNFVLGTKLSVLVGDFLLSKILATLASTENSEVQSILSKVVEHLVIGEAMEMTSSSEQLCSIENYLEMVYNKKASLLANSCKAIAILSGKHEEVAMTAFDYGRYLGYAYRLMDDILDIAGRYATSKNLSPDHANGMLGAPLLFAIEEFPQLRKAVDNKFMKPSELDFALKYLKKSRGMQRTRELATKYAGLALKAIETLPRTNNKDAELSRRALVDLAQKII